MTRKHTFQLSLQGLTKKLQSWEREREMYKSGARALHSRATLHLLNRRARIVWCSGFFSQGELHHGSLSGAKYTSQKKKIRLDLRPWQHIFGLFGTSVPEQHLRPALWCICHWTLRIEFVLFPSKIKEYKLNRSSWLSFFSTETIQRQISSGGYYVIPVLWFCPTWRIVANKIAKTITGMLYSIVLKTGSMDSAMRSFHWIRHHGLWAGDH